jgi:hypothetical protein
MSSYVYSSMRPTFQYYSRKYFFFGHSIGCYLNRVVCQSTLHSFVKVVEVMPFVPTDHTFKVYKSDDLETWDEVGDGLPVSERPSGIYFR